MQLGGVTAVTISLIVHLTADCVSSGSVSMYVRQEAQTVNYVHVNFYNDTFQRLYKCMTDMNSQQCFAQAAFESVGKPFPGLNVKVINVRSNGIPQQFQSSFTCLYSQQANALECTRNTGQCEGKTCTSFRLRSSPACECVHLNWQYPYENLIFDNQTDDNQTDSIEYCNQNCTEPTDVTTNDTTESSTQQTVTSTLPSLPVSDATKNSLNLTNIKSSTIKQSSSNPVAIIIGVVLGVLVVALSVALAAALVFIYRRKKSIKNHNNTGADLSGSDNDPNRIPTMTSIPRTSNGSNDCEELPNLTQGNGIHGKSEDGYYSIDKVDTFPTYQNELNIDSPHNEQSCRIPRGLITYQNEP